MKRKLLVYTVLFFMLLCSSILYLAADNRSGESGGTTVSFRVKWDGKVIPGITKISGLTRETEVIMNRTGGDPNINRRAPGVTQYLPIILQRPRSYNAEFEKWANKVWYREGTAGTESSLQDFRKDVYLEILDDKSRVIMAYIIFRCWPSEYTAIDKLDADDDSAAMEILVLQHEGWQRDVNVLPVM